MKVGTLVKMLTDYDPSETVRIDRSGNLLIGGRGGYIIHMPQTRKKKRQPNSPYRKEGGT